MKRVSDETECTTHITAKRNDHGAVYDVCPIAGHTIGLVNNTWTAPRSATTFTRYQKIMLK